VEIIQACASYMHVCFSYYRVSSEQLASTYAKLLEWRAVCELQNDLPFEPYIGEIYQVPCYDIIKQGQMAVLDSDTSTWKIRWYVAQPQMYLLVDVHAVAAATAAAVAVAV
jgi:hypothetical protein